MKLTEHIHATLETNTGRMSLTEQEKLIMRWLRQANTVLDTYPSLDRPDHIRRVIVDLQEELSEALWDRLRVHGEDCLTDTTKTSDV